MCVQIYRVINGYKDPLRVPNIHLLTPVVPAFSEPDYQKKSLSLHQTLSGVLPVSGLLAEVGFRATEPQQSNNPYLLDLFTRIIMLAVMLPGSDCNPDREQHLGSVLLFITGYYLILLWVLWFSLSIQTRVYGCLRAVPRNTDHTKAQNIDNKK